MSLLHLESFHRASAAGRWLVRVRPPALIAALLAATAAAGWAQSPRDTGPALLGQLSHVPPPAGAPAFRSARDSAEWARAREMAQAAESRRIMIDLFERRLFWMDGVDTLFVAPVAVGSGDTLTYQDHSWEFRTPRGRRVVRAKEESPVWVPPLWHYVRHARETGRELAHLEPGRPVRLSDGSRLLIRGNQVGRLTPEDDFHTLPQGEHIVFDRTVFVPPLGTVNRQVVGELGRYKLDLGDAYLIHGTPHDDSIGEAVTHGCIRLGDEDLDFVYRHIPVGTPVYIY